VEPALDQHAPRDQQRDREYADGVDEGGVPGPGLGSDRGIDQDGEDREPVDEDLHSSEKEADRKDAAPNSAFVADEPAVVLDGRGGMLHTNCSYSAKKQY